MTVIVVGSVVVLAALLGLAAASFWRRQRLLEGPRTRYVDSTIDRPETVVDRPVTEERRIERRSRPSRTSRTHARRLEDDLDEDYEEVETTRRRS